jgi:dolichol kinase
MTDMIQLVLGALLAGSPLIIGEIIARRFGLKKEIARKLIHVLASLAAASLVLFLSLHQIALLGAIFTFVLLAVRRYKLVSALYEIERRSYGEMFFPAGVAVAALLAPSPKAYVIAMLIVGISDTAASIIGGKFGTAKWPHTYATYVGSAAFFLSALVILLCGGTTVSTAIGLGAVLTLIESYSLYGSDNVTIAAVAAFALLNI